MLNTSLRQNIQQYNFKFNYNFYRIEINFIKLCSVQYDLAAVCGSKSYLLVYNFVQLSFENSVVWGIGHLILWHSIPNAVFLSTIFMFNSTVWYSISYFLSFAEFLKCILWLEIEQFENFIAVIMIFWIWCTLFHTYTTVYLKVSNTIE